MKSGLSTSTLSCQVQNQSSQSLYNSNDHLSFHNSQETGLDSLQAVEEHQDSEPGSVDDTEIVVEEP
jgi:hypothetical protein